MDRKKCFSITPSMTCVVTVLSPADAMQARAQKAAEPVPHTNTTQVLFPNERREKTHPTNWISEKAGTVIKL